MIFLIVIFSVKISTLSLVLEDADLRDARAQNEKLSAEFFHDVMDTVIGQTPIKCHGSLVRI